MRLGDWLDEHRMADATLADKLGVDRSTVGRWRAGDSKPRDKTMRRLIEITAGAVTANDFLGAAEEADPEPDGDTPPDPATVRAADLACRSVASADAVVCRSGARPDAVNEFEEVA